MPRNTQHIICALNFPMHTISPKLSVYHLPALLQQIEHVSASKENVDSEGQVNDYPPVFSFILKISVLLILDISLNLYRVLLSNTHNTWYHYCLPLSCTMAPPAISQIPQLTC